MFIINILYTFLFFYYAFFEKSIEITKDYLKITFIFFKKIKTKKINIKDIHKFYISKGYGESPLDSLVIEYEEKNEKKNYVFLQLKVEISKKYALN